MRSDIEVDLVHISRVVAFNCKFPRSIVLLGEIHKKCPSYISKSKGKIIYFAEK